VLIVNPEFAPWKFKYLVAVLLSMALATSSPAGDVVPMAVIALVGFTMLRKLVVHGWTGGTTMLQVRLKLSAGGVPTHPAGEAVKVRVCTPDKQAVHGE